MMFSKSGYLTAVSLIILGVFLGCSSEPPIVPESVHSSSVVSPDLGDNGGFERSRDSIIFPEMDPTCDNMSGILALDIGLVLTAGGSEARYMPGSVLDLTDVSFGICDADTSEFNPSSKITVLGPDPDQRFRFPVDVRLSLEDAGFAPSDTGWFGVFRLDEHEQAWEAVLKNQIEAGECSYQVSRNGTYALSLISTPFDSSWTVIKEITPEDGGVINLRQSKLEVLPGAIAQTEAISFTLIDQRPSGMQNALPRVYEFGPKGLHFDIPATLMVSFDDAGFYPTASDFVVGDQPIYLYWYSETRDGIGSWVRMPDQVQIVDGYLVVDLHHFSRYSFGR